MRAAVEQMQATGVPREGEGRQVPALPPALGIAADLGLVLSLVMVLVGWGAVGTIAALGLGVASLVGVINALVQSLAERERAGPLGAAEPAYALFREDGWHDSRAA